MNMAVLDDPLAFLRRLYEAAVEKAQPRSILPRFLPPPPSGRTVVVGAGKAAGAMAQAVEALWPREAPLSGLVVTRDGHVPPRMNDAPPRVAVVEAAHPVPDARSVRAAWRMLDMVGGLTAEDLVLCLISGGGSSLLALPVEGLSLAEKQSVNRQLLLSGAGIAEMNCVRKHLSRIKGGQLAKACAPAQVITLAISDVPGDDPADIASGPTVADHSTCADALHVLERYRIDLPASIVGLLENGALETPKPGDASFRSTRLELVATPRQSLEAAVAAARAAGVRAHILSDRIEGESRDVGQVHAVLARASCAYGEPFRAPCVILSGGETTVTVKPSPPGSASGRGGRAGEFCLGLAKGLNAAPGAWALAADTDGIDGMEENAGAFVQPDTLARAHTAGRSLEDCLERNDAYGFFSSIGDLLITGPTYTNVNDFRAIFLA